MTQPDSILDNIEVHEKFAIISVNPKLYPLSVIYSAAYWLLDKVHVIIDGDPETEILIEIRQKDQERPVDYKEVGYQFNDELINYAVYTVQATRNQKLREMVMENALVGNLRNSPRRNPDLNFQSPQRQSTPSFPNPQNNVQNTVQNGQDNRFSNPQKATQQTDRPRFAQPNNQLSGQDTNGFSNGVVKGDQLASIQNGVSKQEPVIPPKPLTPVRSQAPMGEANKIGQVSSNWKPGEQLKDPELVAALNRLAEPTKKDSLFKGVDGIDQENITEIKDYRHNTDEFAGVREDL